VLSLCDAERGQHFFRGALFGCGMTGSAPKRPPVSRAFAEPCLNQMVRLTLAITGSEKRGDEGTPLFTVRVDGVAMHLSFDLYEALVLQHRDPVL